MFKKLYKRAQTIITIRAIRRLIELLNKYEDNFLVFIPDMKVRLAIDALTDILGILLEEKT